MERHVANSMRSGSDPGRMISGDARRRRWKRWALGVPAGLLLPFFVLVRLSTWLYLDRGLNGWLAVGCSAAGAAFLLSGAVAILARRLGTRPGPWLLNSTFVMLAAYTFYLLLYISAVNVKSSGIRDTYRHLHPVLRVTLSTFVILDRNAVVTDTARRPEDYRMMGLSVANRSSHYEQRDGYVHAIDLRTSDRSPGRNFLTRLYFEAMGFDTLRHVGTADHLHVSLPLR